MIDAKHFFKLRHWGGNSTRTMASVYPSRNKPWLCGTNKVRSSGYLPKTRALNGCPLEGSPSPMWKNKSPWPPMRPTTFGPMRLLEKATLAELVHSKPPSFLPASKWIREKSRWSNEQEWVSGNASCMNIWCVYGYNYISMYMTYHDMYPQAT